MSYLWTFTCPEWMGFRPRSTFVRLIKLRLSLPLLQSEIDEMRKKIMEAGMNDIILSPTMYRTFEYDLTNLNPVYWNRYSVCVKKFNCTASSRSQLGAMISAPARFMAISCSIVITASDLASLFGSSFNHGVFTTNLIPQLRDVYRIPNFPDNVQIAKSRSLPSLGLPLPSTSIVLPARPRCGRQGPI